MRAEISLRKDSARMFIYLSLQKEIQRFDDFNSVLCLRKITLQGNDNFFVAVPDSAQRCKLPLSRFRHAVLLDLSKYFDTLNHELLLNILRREIHDERVIQWIKRYLKSGVMENGVVHETAEGSPQGGNLSPLLANIYLNEFDKEFEKRGGAFVRYADDIVRKEGLMAYFLRQEKKKQRIYLQMYENFWDKQKKQPRTRHIETFGYVDELISDEMPDPIAHFQAYVKERETQRLASQAEETRPRAFSRTFEKYAGHFLLDALFLELNVKEDLDILRCYEKHYKRDLRTTFFDCTNYYFEIDLPCDDKQKGPSKENRQDPIIGQALLLDADLVPLAMQMYPGNESENPYIRKLMEEMKQRHQVSGKTVQVADKGLNCARNIYAAVKEADDGYIFSKSIHGRGLSEKEKQWLLLEDNEKNRFTDYRDKNGKLLYRLKSCVDTFSYRFKQIDPQTGQEVVTTFSVKEKRVVSYNPSLAKKQRTEILKMADKAANYTTHKKMLREELGDAVKYLKVTNTDKDGKKVSPVTSIDHSKLNEDLRYAGYNLLVTSELNMTADEVYHTYHNLWKIEESFRLTKSYLDARPVYLQKKETIYGHFLICYLSLFLLRILEIKYFKNQINSYDLIHFMRDFRVVEKGDGSFLNISRNQCVNEKVKKLTGLTTVDALYLSEKELDNLFQNCMLIDS